jgi:hypothetical protein
MQSAAENWQRMIRQRPHKIGSPFLPHEGEWRRPWTRPSRICTWGWSFIFSQSNQRSTSSLSFIARKFTAALALITRVGHEYGETVGKEQFRKSKHAFAIVFDAMEKNYGVGVRNGWIQKPTAKIAAIVRTDRSVFEHGAEARGD